MQQHRGLPADSLRFIYHGKSLIDGNTFNDYQGIVPNGLIHCVMRIRNDWPPDDDNDDV